jgi:hypothetical protein
MLVSSFNLSQSFNYTPYLFYKKNRFKTEIISFCIRTLSALIFNNDLLRCLFLYISPWSIPAGRAERRPEERDSIPRGEGGSSLLTSTMPSKKKYFFIEEATFPRGIIFSPCSDCNTERRRHRLNMEVDLQSLFGLHVT